MVKGDVYVYLSDLNHRYCRGFQGPRVLKIMDCRSERRIKYKT